MRILKNKLTKSLESASKHHHNYEKNILKGKRDKNWAGWYAGHILGKIKRLQKHFSVSELAKHLEKAAKTYEGDNWAKKYSEYVVNELKNRKFRKGKKIALKI